MRETTAFNDNGLNVGNLRVLARELYTPDSFAAYGGGSRFNGYHRSDSDVDLTIVTQRTLDLRYVKTADIPVPVNVGYITREALENFSIRRRTGLPFRVQPLGEDDYVSSLAFGTKEELAHRTVSTYHDRVGNGIVPVLLPIASLMTHQNIFEYWLIPKWIRAMKSTATADILTGEYTPVFDKLAEQGFFTKDDAGNYLINPQGVPNSVELHESLPRLLIHGFRLIRPNLLNGGIQMDRSTLKLLPLVRDTVTILPSLAEKKRMLKQAANDFIGIPEYFV
ncbi:MAG: hypothetical protein HY361_04690 [Candidatus Aenigmarchaeota archaeon]|nr:hypothetical protein [Candidatus Aenigmarchaeota archaeon]